MDAFRQISKEVLGENPWWRYCHDKFLLPDGNEADYFYGETVGSGAAMVIPMTDDGRLVLVVQHRYLQEKKSIEFPCGGMKIDERPQEAAERELVEETGLKSSDMIMVGSFEGLNGVFKDTIHVFVAKELENTGQPSQDPVEQTEIIFRRIDEFDEMVKRGEIWDGKTLAAWAIAGDYLLKP